MRERSGRTSLTNVAKSRSAPDGLLAEPQIGREEVARGWRWRKIEEGGNEMITDRIGTEVGIMANRVRRKFRNGASGISSMQSTLASKTRRCASKTDYLVHENAWKLLGITAALAVVGGFFLARRYGPVILGEVEGTAIDATGETRQVKVKKYSPMGMVQSLLPFALFLMKARKESKVPEKVELTAA